jgi:hypothetical protein
MLSHMKFSESDFATVIEINVIKYNDEAWRLAMLMNASMYKLFIRFIRKLTKVL